MRTQQLLLSQILIQNSPGLWTLDLPLQKKRFIRRISTLSFRESKEKNITKVEELAKKVVQNNISVRDLEDISSQEKVEKRVPINRQSKTNEYQYIEEELRDILGTKVKVDNKKIEIFFESKVDLTRILDILNVNVE